MGRVRPRRERRAFMARALWKGAISFGLVYIPVQLYSATKAATIDLDFLDSRDFAPVGYQRVNKRTGKVVEWGDIVKGYQYKKGQYVALSDEDFRQANVKASQTVDIQQFVDATDIQPELYDTPYYMAPAKGGEKVYALLREALKREGKVAVATVVIRTRQHVAVVHPTDRALLLNTLRFANEIRDTEDLDLPAASAKSVGLAPAELSMAQKLVREMSGEWEPAKFHDSYREDLMKRINEKVRKKQTHTLTPASKEGKERKSAEIIDLMAVLKRSLAKGNGKNAEADADESRPKSKATSSRTRSKAAAPKRRAPRKARSSSRAAASG